MTASPIRLLDLAPVSPLRSQTIYHAVGYALGADSPDTIMLVSPNAPYVSIGRHQDAAREVDLPDCAEVVVGSLMFDFDVATMARVLKVPSEKFRDKIIQSLTDYMTTMRKELGEPPARETVIAAYLDACRAVMGRDIERGELRADELALAEKLDARFAGREWLEEAGGLRKPFVKIPEGVRAAEAAHKAPGGLIRCVLRVRDGHVDDIAFSGDFTARPPSMPFSRPRRR